METAEEFAYELDHCNSHSWSGSSFDRKEAASLIRERDAAVALATISEVFALVAERTGGVGTAQGHVYSAALLDLADKYSQPSQKSQEGGG